MIQKQIGRNKGQLTMINMIMLVVTLVLYAVFAVPVLTPLINSAVVTLNATPNEYTPVIVALIQLILLFLLLMILITGLNYAMPRREGF